MLPVKEVHNNSLNLISINLFTPKRLSESVIDNTYLSKPYRTVKELKYSK